MEKTSKPIRKAAAVLAVLTMLAAALVLSGCSKPREPQETDVPETQGVPETTAAWEEESMPWDEPGAKQPGEYSWAEFEALSGAQQMKFQQSFAGAGAFEAWMEQARGEDQTAQSVMPWEISGARQPEDYTWEDFCALNQEQQIAFQKAFETEEAFEAWLERVNPSGTEEETAPADHPWEEPGGKQPWEYTWAEFLALTPEQQIAFQNSFESDEAFAQWKERVEPQETAPSAMYPWQEPDAKQPADYTWEEFLALTPEQQIAFQKTFPDMDAFEAWMEAAAPEELCPWDYPGAKQPEEYTWEEFLALAPEQQMLFQQAFEESDGFLDWYEKNAP